MSKALQDSAADQGPFIRTVVDDGVRYFSILDILTTLDVTKSPSSYWGKMKARAASEGFAETLQKVRVFRLQARDKRFRETECADEETLLRLLQSVPSASPKLENIKLWLAQVGTEKLNEQALPEAAFEQMRDSYVEKGYPLSWANTRAQGDLVRNALTDTWSERGADGGRDYAYLTNIMTRKVFGFTVQEYKTFKNLPPKANLRDHMSEMALGVQAYTEALTNTLHTARDTQGMPDLTRDVLDAGDLGHEARTRAERLIGSPIDTPDNYLHLTQKKRESGKKNLRKAQPRITGPTLFDGQ
jgi:hypothetical protein